MINCFYLIFSPTSPFCGVNNPIESSVASNIPWDSIPNSLAGCKFTITITFWFNISSGLYDLANPATICNVFSLISTCNLSNLSDFNILRTFLSSERYMYLLKI